MFWKKARKNYSNVTTDDNDIQKYFEVMNQIQSDGYNGIMGYIQDFGHKYVQNNINKNEKVLEIGFGKGRSSKYFKWEKKDYYPSELNEKYVTPQIWNSYKNATLADATNLPFEDNYFDKVVTIYNLEHIEDTDKVLAELKRVLKKDGEVLIALPCEDGFLWNMGRELTTRRIFTKKYKINYDKVIAYEHVHNLEFLRRKIRESYFICEEKYYPFFIPSINMNLIYTCKCKI